MRYREVRFYIFTDDFNHHTGRNLFRAPERESHGPVSRVRRHVVFAMGQR